MVNTKFSTCIFHTHTHTDKGIQFQNIYVWKNECDFLIFHSSHIHKSWVFLCIYIYKNSYKSCKSSWDLNPWRFVRIKIWLTFKCLVVDFIYFLTFTNKMCAIYITPYNITQIKQILQLEVWHYIDIDINKDKKSI